MNENEPKKTTEDVFETLIRKEHEDFMNPLNPCSPISIMNQNFFNNIGG